MVSRKNVAVWWTQDSGKSRKNADLILVWTQVPVLSSRAGRHHLSALASVSLAVNEKTDKMGLEVPSGFKFPSLCSVAGTCVL